MSLKLLPRLWMVVILVLLVTPVLSTLPAALAQDSVEITFVHIFPDERDVRRTTIEEIAAAFMAQNPGVVVTIETTTDDYDAVFEGALRAAGQGNAPSVVQVEDTLTQIAIDSQAFVKLSNYATPEQLATIPDILEPVRNYYSIQEDDFWNLPWNASNPIMYYNPVIFEAAGLDPENPPRTFADITAACDAIMASGVESLTGCVNWPISSWFVEQWVAMQGGLLANNDNGRSARATEMYLDSPELLAVMTWWKDLADKGYFTYSGTPEAYTPEGLLFVTGKTAIHISTSAGLSNIQKFAPTMGKFEPRVTAFPLPNEEATNGVAAGGAAVWVMGGQSEAETRAAVDFVFFLTNAENIATWHTVSGYYPVRQSSIDQLEAEGWFEQNPVYRIPLDQLLNSEPNAANGGMVLGAYSQVRTALVEAALSIIDNGEDPTAALAAAKERADKALADYNSMMGE